MRTFDLVAILTLSPLPFLYGMRTTARRTDPSAPANGLVLCDGQDHLLRFVLKPGGKAKRDLLIENRSDKPIAINRVESSCDCLTLLTPLADLRFKPGERTKLRVAVDLSKDPKYVGGFGPRLDFLTGSETTGQTLPFDVEVAR